MLRLRKLLVSQNFAQDASACGWAKVTILLFTLIKISFGGQNNGTCDEDIQFHSLSTSSLYHCQYDHKRVIEVVTIPANTDCKQSGFDRMGTLICIIHRNSV